MRRTLFALAATAVTLFAASAASAYPLPDNDPFYAVPANIGALANGTILKSRPITATVLSVPLAVHAYQLEYKTLDGQGNPTADVTTVMVPVTPWLGKGPRPVVSYQTAEDGVGTQCAASYAIDSGLLSLPSNAELETVLMGAAIANGWTVVASDYEGPRSHFLGFADEAHGVLDGIRAARAFQAAAIASNAPIGLWGYSGGAYATAAAAQTQAAYAPELHLSAIAMGGVVGDVKATMNDFSGSLAGGALIVGLIGVDRSFPGADIEQYLNATALRDMAAGQTDCIAQAALQFPLLSIQQLEAFPDSVDQPAVTALLQQDSPEWAGGLPTAPVYDYHAVSDELAPIGPDRALMARYCAGGVTVDHVEDPVGEHITEAVTGVPGALSYLSARFAGRSAPNTC